MRYRGYYYDTDSQLYYLQSRYYDPETGLYYLQSRYYDPELGRFLNADSYASTGQGILGCNMFAYCNNNPIMFKDTCGTAPWPTTVAIDDGGYAKLFIETDDDPNSRDLSKNAIPMPNSNSTIFTKIQRDGHYTYDPDDDIDWLFALCGVVCFLVPGPVDDFVLAKPAKEVVGALLEIWSFKEDILTLSNLPSNVKIYDRYSVTQQWITKEPISGRTDMYNEVSHSMVSYYYCKKNERGECDWYSCGTSYSFTIETYFVP